jgi:Cse1.
LFQSDALYTEINHVLGKFGTPFLALFEVSSFSTQFCFREPNANKFQALDNYLEQNKTNKENLTQGFNQLNLMVKLFYDLSSHETCMPCADA